MWSFIFSALTLSSFRDVPGSVTTPKKRYLSATNAIATLALATVVGISADTVDDAVGCIDDGGVVTGT